MVEYLDDQLEKQEQAIGKLQYATACSDRELPTAQMLFIMLAEVNRYSRYIRHALQEAHDCEHCKENGLIVTLDCYDSSEDIQSDFLPEPE